MRIHPLRSLAAALLGIMALLPLLATAQQGHSPVQATPPASPPVASTPVSWMVDAVEVVDFAGSPATLSPDGSLLAGIGEEWELCIWSVDSFEATCDKPSTSTINPDSITWSPDGTAVAYTLDAFLRGEESDLFVFELDAGVSVNLTDDGVEGSFFSSSNDDAAMLVDVMPLWSADSQSLIFARSDFSREEPGTHLMSISRKGGEPVPVATVSDFPFAIFTPMHHLSDGTLVFTLGPGDMDDPDTGIWTLPPGGEPSQVLSTPTDSEFPLAVVTDVHEADGTILVAAYSYSGLTQLIGEGPIAFILDIGTGNVVPLESEVPGLIVGPTVFSPDGATTFSATPAGDGDTLVMIQGGEQEVIELGSGDVSASGSVWMHVGIEWRGDGTLFLPAATTRDPYLVTLVGQDVP